jgi:hypothetical protein
MGFLDVVKNFTSLYTDPQLTGTQNTKQSLFNMPQTYATYYEQSGGTRDESGDSQLKTVPTTPKTNTTPGATTTNGLTPTGTTGTWEPEQEPIPGSDIPSIDDMVGGAISELESFENFLQTQDMPAREQEIQASGASQKGTLQSNLATQETATETERARGRRGTETLVGEARQGFSELQQGAMSRFGGAKSTGMAAMEILGREALKNISNARAVYNDFSADLSQKIFNLRNETTQKIQQVDVQMQSELAEARRELAANLSDIAVKKGQLRMGAYELRLGALQNYQQLVSDIKARNVQYKNEYQTRLLEGQQTIDEINARAKASLDSAVNKWSYVFKNTGTGLEQEMIAYRPNPNAEGGFETKPVTSSEYGFGNKITPEEEDDTDLDTVGMQELEEAGVLGQ